MRSREQNADATAAVLAMAGMHNLPALACGFDSLIDDTVASTYPLSMAVAFAIQDAEADNLLDRRMTAPKAGDLVALFRATQRLHEWRAAMQAERASNPEVAIPSFSLLLVEPGMWNRYSLGKEVRLALHTDGPPAGDPIVVTGESVLAAMAEGRLGVERAWRRGLIALEGPQELQRFLKNLAPKLSHHGE